MALLPECSFLKSPEIRNRLQLLDKFTWYRRINKNHRWERCLELNLEP